MDNIVAALFVLCFTAAILVFYALIGWLMLGLAVLYAVIVVVAKVVVWVAERREK